ncbi:hypothetical protein WUBG_00215 [Wuchereria bancrofti]|nr:hypothetical protein WUBG_00215 [Wuchereria bancrofti]
MRKWEKNKEHLDISGFSADPIHDDTTVLISTPWLCFFHFVRLFWNQILNMKNGNRILSEMERKTTTEFSINEESQRDLCFRIRSNILKTIHYEYINNPLNFMNVS